MEQSQSSSGSLNREKIDKQKEKYKLLLDLPLDLQFNVILMLMSHENIIPPTYREDVSVLQAETFRKRIELPFFDFTPYHSLVESQAITLVRPFPGLQSITTHNIFGIYNNRLLQWLSNFTQLRFLILYLQPEDSFCKAILPLERLTIISNGMFTIQQPMLDVLMSIQLLDNLTIHGGYLSRAAISLLETKIYAGLDLENTISEAVDKVELLRVITNKRRLERLSLKYTPIAEKDQIKNTLPYIIKNFLDKLPYVELAIKILRISVSREVLSLEKIKNLNQLKQLRIFCDVSTSSINYESFESLKRLSTDRVNVKFVIQLEKNEKFDKFKLQQEHGPFPINVIVQ